MTRRRKASLGLAVLLTAAAPPPPAVPAPDIAGQFADLAFDANPQTFVPARQGLSRWAGPMRLFIFGSPPQRQDTALVASVLSRAAHLPIRIVTESEAVSQPPNSFLVLDENLVGAFRGPLRPMLRNAFLDNEGAVDNFISGVVAVQPCWTLPIWADAAHTVLKAGVVGVDARLPRRDLRRCLLRQLGAALGLLGPADSLHGSIFNAQRPGWWLSHDDTTMLRLLYDPALQPGMSREQARDAATALLRHPR